jgi:hypothetical protein
MVGMVQSLLLKNWVFLTRKVFRELSCLAFSRDLMSMKGLEGSGYTKPRAVN